MSELDNKSREESRKRRSGLVHAVLGFFTIAPPATELPTTTTKEEETDMSDKHESKGMGKGSVNRHKEMAMGEKIKVMKKGGPVHKDEKEDKKMMEKMIKPSSMKKMAMGGCMKKGGTPKKKK